MNTDHLSLKETSVFLGITESTVRNWVKCGDLIAANESKKLLFSRNTLEAVQERIRTGKLDRLSKRANKRSAAKIFIPSEYVKNKQDLVKIKKILQIIHNANLPADKAVFMLILNLLKREKIIPKQHNLTEFDIPGRVNLSTDLNKWYNSLAKFEYSEPYYKLLIAELPYQSDIPGLIYQSILSEGQKSKTGSYYTPEEVVKDLFLHCDNITNYFDPCCGTGQFLLTAAEFISAPENIYGTDIDETAVRIARVNMFLKYRNQDFSPKIYCSNALFGSKLSLPAFSLIATNPPWGSHFSAADKEELQKYYPEIKSNESFSYFLKKGIDLLKPDGLLSFILPESFLNIRCHSDIRKYILTNTQVTGIKLYKKLFKNVFSKVIRLSLKKSRNIGKVKICMPADSYEIPQQRFLDNENYIFNISLSEKDLVIVEKVYSEKHTTLNGAADWALGIVTGDNNKFILKSKPDNSYEKIYKGKDLSPYFFKDVENYIKFNPASFQQTAPEKRYRADEKLVYKFINRNLVFAYDTGKRLTLNSANILIPDPCKYPVKVILALFNSTLYNFIFRKSFASLKVLRGQLEQLPLPLWSKSRFSEMTTLVDQILSGIDRYDDLNNLIMNYYNISLTEKEYIIDYMKKK